jgi:hypothetical protein
VHLLLNLADDNKVEAKMVNRSIAECLCKLLDRRHNQSLCTLVCQFLTKLCLYAENKDMAVHDTDMCRT